MPIDLFSLYVLFSHFRPRDATRGNSFFQMSSYARANLRITNEKGKENSHVGITWSEMGKQDVQAEKVYCDTQTTKPVLRNHALRNRLLLGCDTFILLVSCINRL